MHVRRRIQRVPGTELGTPLLWLVVVPTAFGFGVWFPFVVPLGPGSLHWQIAALGFAVLGFLPLAGLLSVLGYKWISGDRVRLMPYLPFAVAAVVFAPLMVDVALETTSDPYAESFPFYQGLACLFVGLFEPWLALVGGIISYRRDR